MARQVDDGVAERVKALRDLRIVFQTEPRRFYPSNDLASPTLGVVGIDDTGLSGAEYWLYYMLTGHAGTRKEEVDQFGRRIPETAQKVTPAAPGKDVVLTLDSGIQTKHSEPLLTRQLADADGGTAMVLDIESGDILAVATVAKSKDGTVLVPSDATQHNSAFTDVYEPGFHEQDRHHGGGDRGWGCWTADQPRCAVDHLAGGCVPANQHRARWRADDRHPDL